MKNPDWDDFRVFAAVVRTGSFTRAARELALSEPTVSRRIGRLESALGARLFDRGKGAPQLTAEGKRVLNYATAAEHSLSRAAIATEEASREVAGDCNLIMGEGLGTYWFPPFLSAFLSRYPEINLRLFTSQELGRDQTPPFDIQIHYLHPLAHHHVAIQVASLHFLLYAAPSYVKEFGIPKEFADLRTHRVGDSTSHFTERGSLASWANLYQGISMTTNSSVLLCQSIEKGSLIGLLPSYLSVLEPSLVPLLPEMHFRAPIFVCFEREVGKKPAVRAMIDFLRKRVFDPKLPWFAPHFIAPEKGWQKLYGDFLSRAAKT